MGNSVSALYKTKVFRPYPVIRLDPSIHWWKKLVSLRTIKFGVLGGKVTVHV